MNASKPYEWVKKIDSALVDLDKIPQFILPSQFPIEAIEKNLQSLFEIPSITISSDLKGWVSSDEILKSLPASPRALKINWAPLLNPIYFILAIQDLKILTAHLMGGEETASLLSENEYSEGFYHYLLLEVIQQIKLNQFASPLSPQLGGSVEDISERIESEQFFVAEILMQYNERKLWGKILISQTFRKEWNEYFSTHPPVDAISSRQRMQIPVEVGLEVGHVALNLQDWKEVKTGDVVILDRCSYNTKEKKGSLFLTLGEKKIFRGRFKDHDIKLMEYPFYEEVDESMNDDFSEEDEDEDEDIYNDLDEDVEEEDEEEDEEDENENIFDELPEEEVEEEKEYSSSLNEEEKPSISIENLPIRVAVEVGRIKMTAQELADLSPGNLIKLNITPEQGVNLVINGEKVGRGELVQIGDTLGVRIISL